MPAQMSGLYGLQALRIWQVHRWSDGGLRALHPFEFLPDARLTSAAADLGRANLRLCPTDRKPGDKPVCCRFGLSA